jgi:hypothetical protein
LSNHSDVLFGETKETDMQTAIQKQMLKTYSRVSYTAKSLAHQASTADRKGIITRTILVEITY